MSQQFTFTTDENETLRVTIRHRMGAHRESSGSYVILSSVEDSDGHALDLEHEPVSPALKEKYVEMIGALRERGITTSVRGRSEPVANLAVLDTVEQDDIYRAALKGMVAQLPDADRAISDDMANLARAHQSAVVATEMEPAAAKFASDVYQSIAGAHAAIPISHVVEAKGSDEEVADRLSAAMHAAGFQQANARRVAERPGWKQGM